MTEFILAFALRSDLLRLGRARGQDVFPPPLPLSTHPRMVQTSYDIRGWVSVYMVYFCHGDCYRRMSTCVFLLAASSTTSQHRLSEVLLGKRHVEHVAGHYHLMSSHTTNLEVADVY